MKAEKRGEGLMKRVRSSCREVFSHGCRGELTGRRRLMIQGCDRILDYNESCIRLLMRSGEVQEMLIGGTDLCCQSYHPDAIVIVGKILRIELVGKEGARED